MNESNYILGPSSSPDTAELTKALSKAQADYQHIALDSANPHFRSRFSSYSQCCDSLRGPLTKNGLALPDFRPGFVQGMWVLVGTLRHTSGQWISGVAPLINPKGDMQGFGAACTYAKRTLLMALTGGFSGETDDDGNEVSAPAVKAAVKTSVNTLAYEAEAKKAIVTAKDESTAQKHLDTVRLRVREKACTPDVYKRCEEEFNKKWKGELVSNG
jgi:hypothetical protein